jgi:PAS domain S-box-containing protein
MHEPQLHPDLFEAVPDALLTVDTHGRVIRANRHAEELFGYPSGGLDGLDVDALVPAAARDRHRQHRAGYMARPRTRPMGATEQSLTGLRRDGSEFPVEIALSPFTGAEGTCFLASVRDISRTARERQAEARERYHALEVRIARLVLEQAGTARLVERLPSLLAEVLDVQSVAIWLPGDDGRHATQCEQVGPQWTAAFAAGAAQALPADAIVVEDCARPLADASGFPVALPATGCAAYLPLFDRDRIMGALLAADPQPGRFGRDARHLLQNASHMLSAALRQRRIEEQLTHAQRLDAIGQLTGGIAHDFNNLLTVLSGSLQLLETECRSDSGQELIASALRSVGRGAELTGKLLAFARRQRLLPRSVDVAALFADVSAMLRRTLGDAIRMETDLAQPLPDVYVDPGQLEAALVNLALNARDAMPQGGTIRLGARHAPIGATGAEPEVPAGDFVRISVSDTGRGMAAETLERATEPFFTTKGAGRGSGLGLSMVYGFVRQSGGGLRIESAPGSGTRVILYLPTARDRPQALPAAAAPHASGRGESVLVVEDDADVRGIACAFLRSAGFRVVAAADAAQALALLDGGEPVDLLFTDLMLGPGMDGHALAREARLRRPQLAVLLASGDEARAGIPTGFSLLRKPYLRDRLTAEVRRLLDLSAEAPGASA